MKPLFCELFYIFSLKRLVVKFIVLIITQRDLLSGFLEF